MSEAGNDPVEGLLAVLNLHDSSARTTEDIFTGVSHDTPWGRIYGGQVVAQSIIAAQRTVAPDRILHSTHGYFLRPGDTAAGITFSVDRIHDGRSFSTRRTQAFQNGVPIWSMIASFQDTDPGVEHFEPMPEGIPEPESLPSEDDIIENLDPRVRDLIARHPIEVRYVERSLWSTPDESRANSQHVWMRSRGPLPDDPGLHRAVLAYMSDLNIQESVIRTNGLSWATPGLRLASLDHAIWWHRFARMDEWVLFAQQSPNARGGRGLATGSVYTREGTLVATIAQEIMVRVPETH